MEDTTPGETDNQKFESVPENWPRCCPEQVQVMLLGTYHMDDPGLDEVNAEGDDVLAADRQAQLRELVDHLTVWNPDRIAVERPHDNTGAVNDLYESYASGEYAYDCEETFPATHPIRNGGRSGCRNEVIQVGFRLADRLDHDYVLPIDEHPQEPDADPFENREIDSGRKTAITLPDIEAETEEEAELLASSTLLEYFVEMNSGEMRGNHDGMFDRGIRAVDKRFGSPLALAHWYDRNIRMVHHLWRGMCASDERILLLVGSGHIRILRHLLDEAPMFCSESPLPYLS